MKLELSDEDVNEIGDQVRYYGNAEKVQVLALIRDRATMTDRIAALVAENERLSKAERAYGGLLATIFRDGGHRRCKIGDDAKAGDAAREVVIGERVENERLRGAMKEIEDQFHNGDLTPFEYSIMRKASAALAATGTPGETGERHAD